MSNPAKRQLAALSRSGPHQVLRGDLGPVGLPGVVFAPRAGRALPAVAFGHGWLQPTNRYLGLLRHLASWGFVVAAPDTERGPLPSHQLYANDLRTALDVCAGVRLGEGEIQVDTRRLGLAGHSTGAGAAVLAAAEDERVRAVGTVAVAQIGPGTTEAAARCAMPGLHLAGGLDLAAPAIGHAELIARAWQGPVLLRTMPKASHLGVAEGLHWSGLLWGGRPEYSTQRVAKAMLTAFFLVCLAGDDQYRTLLTQPISACTLDYHHNAALSGAS